MFAANSDRLIVRVQRSDLSSTVYVMSQVGWSVQSMLAMVESVLITFRRTKPSHI